MILLPEPAGAPWRSQDGFINPFRHSVYVWERAICSALAHLGLQYEFPENQCQVRTVKYGKKGFEFVELTFQPEEANNRFLSEDILLQSLIDHEMIEEVIAPSWYRTGTDN